MTFYVQIRDMHGKWKLAKYTGSFCSEAAAWDHIRIYDEDGLITPEYRVVDSSGKAMSRPS